MNSVWQWFLLFSLLLSAGCSPEPAELWQGYVEGEFIAVSSPVGGRVEALNVVKGQQVAAGQALFALEPEPERSRLAEAESRVGQRQSVLENLTKGQRPSELSAIRARLERALSAERLAAIEYERVGRLIETRAASREQLDRVRSSLEQARHQVAGVRAELETAGLGARADEISAARASLDEARAQLAMARWHLAQKTRLAPGPAQVIDTLYRLGEWVPPGRPVVSLLPPENRKVRFYVPEPLINSFSLEQEVYIHVDGAKTPVRARVSYIAPQAEYTPPVIYSSRSRAKLVFLLEAKPAMEDALLLKPGQPVDISRDGQAGPVGRSSLFHRLVSRLVKPGHGG